MNLFDEVEKIGENTSREVEKYREEYKNYTDKDLLFNLKLTYSVSPKRLAIVSMLRERGYEYSDLS